MIAARGFNPGLIPIKYYGGMETRNCIKAAVDECFATRRRVPIPRYTKILSLGGDLRISRKSIKYIVDSRKDDGYGIERMRKMFQRMPEVLRSPDADFLNPTRRYPNSRIAVKRYPREREALIVVYQPDGRTKSAFNCYYRAEKKLNGKYGEIK